MNPQERAELLDRLNERLADKTLSFGCRVKNNWADSHLPYIFVGNGEYWSEQFKWRFKPRKKRKDEDREPLTIIGHPVNIGRVIEVVSKTEFHPNLGGFSAILVMIIHHWRGSGFEKPIEELSDECLEYLSSLFLGTKE